MAEVVTGEAVVVDVPCARFPSRLVALAIDLLIQGILLFGVFVVIGILATHGDLDAASGAAAAVTGLVIVVIGYPVVWETLTRGRSPGKFALGLRVVGDDGSPERFRQALVRGLASAVEIWLLGGAPALICSLLSARGKRLGDLFAGTFVVQQRLPARRGVAGPPAVPPHLATWAAGLDLSGLTDPVAETARRYLARAPELSPAARDDLGQRIAAAVNAQVGPPPAGTPAAAYLSALLAERRRRESARLARLGRPPGTADAPAFQGGTRDSGQAEAPWKGEGGSAPGRAPRPGWAQGSAEAPTGFVPPV